MASIFQVLGTIFIDNSKANESIDGTTEKAEKSSSKVGSAFAAIGKGAAAMGTAVVAGASAIGGAAYKIASDTAKSADEVDKVSQKLGMSREAYQEWDYVLSQSGVEITSMTTGLKTLTNKIDDAKNGGKSATAMFDKLGISMSDLNEMSREEAFDAVIKGMQSMEDSTERAALANDLFGKSGQELTALFNQTAESTESLKNQAHELGMVMSDETIDSGVKFTDTMDTIKRSLGGMLNTLGGTVMPIVQSVLELIISKIPDIKALFSRLTPIIKELFDGILPPLFELVETLLPILFELIETLLPVIQDTITAILPVIVSLLQQLLPFVMQIIEQVLPMVVNLVAALLPLVMQIIETVLPLIVQLLQAILPPLLQIIEAILPVVISLLDALLPVIQPILDILMILLEPLIDVLNLILPPLISLFTGLINKALTPLEAALGVVANVLNTVFKGAFENIGKVVRNIKNVFSGIIDFVKNVFTRNWRGAWDAVVKIFSNIFEGIKNAFKMPINWIIDGINVFIRGLNKLKIPDWVPGVGGMGLNISEISRLRIGMEYVPYDEYPALLHKGERVLTASENKEYSTATSEAADDYTDGRPVIKIELGEKAVYIENLKGDSKQDVESFVDLLLELIAEKIQRKGVVFA